MTTPASRTLVLFDIDGTLVLTGRAGLRGMNAAFADLYGVDGALDAVPVAGRTDRAIVSDVLGGLAVEPTDAAIERLRDAYVGHLRVAIEKPVPHFKGVLPGVASLLDALDALPGVAVGLLTGNFEAGAAVKLGHFDLWRRFGFGAFGDRHANRRDLVPEALGQAGRAGVPVTAGRTVVIGDTPLDVDCAIAHGARAIGVTTGPYARHELRDAGAHLVVDDLSDIERVVSFVTGDP